MNHQEEQEARSHLPTAAWNDQSVSAKLEIVLDALAASKNRERQLEIRAAGQAQGLFNELVKVRSEHDRMANSTLWRATRLLRVVAAGLPIGLRRGLLSNIKQAWRVLVQKRLPSPQISPDAAPIAAQSDFSFPDLAASNSASDPDSAISRFDYSEIVFISQRYTRSHRYRVLQAAEAVGSASYIQPFEIGAYIEKIARADILWLSQTPWDSDIAQAVDAARYGGAKIIFDTDEPISNPQTERDAIDDAPMAAPERNGAQNRMSKTMTAADLCIAATDELAYDMRETGAPVCVLPSGFDQNIFNDSRVAIRKRNAAVDDRIVRIGYVGDDPAAYLRNLSICVVALADILTAHPQCRLVALCLNDGMYESVDLAGIHEFRGLEDRIEWRKSFSPEALQSEIARFDINLIPLDQNNDRDRAKSELDFVLAALVEVPTIAHPSNPFKRVVVQGKTGMLASSVSEWRDSLETLTADAALRMEIGKAAYLSVLWPFGPERRADLISGLRDIALGGARAAEAFQRSILSRRATASASPPIPRHEVVFTSNQGRVAAITIVVPLYNYADYIVEALESARAQDLKDLELVIVDDCSTDSSFELALNWANANSDRFTRIAVARNHLNSGLALTRNAAFKIADTAYVLPLDADNILLRNCASACLKRITDTKAAYVYPALQQFGIASEIVGSQSYDPVRLANNNYIDAMALISRAAWLAAGGYADITGGWEDFDFWCRLAELGLRGEQVLGPPLARYRTHDSSMIKTATRDHARILSMMQQLKNRHPWLTLVWPLPNPPSKEVCEYMERNRLP